MTVYGVFYTPDFNEELYSTEHLFHNENEAAASMRNIALDCYGPWELDGGWESEDVMIQSYIASCNFRVRPLTVK